MVILFATLYLAVGVALCVAAELRDESGLGFNGIVRAICVAGWPIFISVGVLDYIVQKILNILDGK